jgi:hypothetical protein
MLNVVRLSIVEPYLACLSATKKKWMHKIDCWGDSADDDAAADESNRRKDVVPSDASLFPERRSSDDGIASPNDVINVTPSSFSDIFIKPRLAALAVQVSISQNLLRT